MKAVEGGTKPSGEGWFAVNARDAQWVHTPTFGAGVTFAGEPRFSQLGINIQVLWPCQPSGLHHAEEAQEDFLALQGQCLLVIEGEERPLRAWDFVHCPPGTAHILGGAGDGPCIFVGVGVRTTDEGIVYPVSGPALRRAAGVAEETTSFEAAYAGLPRTTVGGCPPGVLPGG